MALHKVYDDDLPSAFSPIPTSMPPIASGDNNIKNDGIVTSRDTPNRNMLSSDILVTSLNLPSSLRSDLCTPSADIPTIPSHHPATKLNMTKSISKPVLLDGDFVSQFRLPDAAYIEQPGKHTIQVAWQTYLATNNYLSSFLPLRGTERDRYRQIIEEAHAEEIQRHDAALKTIEVLQKVAPIIDYLRNTYLLPNPPRRCESAPPPTGTRYAKDSALFQRGYIKLDKYFASLRRESRHDRHYPDLMKASFLTPFGMLDAAVVLPAEPWYMGHRPGDPICRIRSRPNEEDRFFFVPELAGSEDGDDGETHVLRFEGVVPFNSQELYQRFTKHALPAFVRMVIAAIGFDPRDPDHEAHLGMKEIEDMQTWEFEEVSEREKARCLKLLRRVWNVKYGVGTCKIPRFLKAQIATSISRLRETGWLMSRLEREAPDHASHHYWAHCKGLLQDFTGRDAALLAQEYYDITLAAEAEEMLRDGDVGNMLLYQQNKKSRERVKLQDFYDHEGPDLGLTRNEIKKLHEIATEHLKTKKILCSEQEDKFAGPIAPLLPCSNSSEDRSASTSHSITVATTGTTSTTGQGVRPQKRGRSESIEDIETEGYSSKKPKVSETDQDRDVTPDALPTSPSTRRGRSSFTSTKSDSTSQPRELLKKRARRGLKKRLEHK